MPSTYVPAKVATEFITFIALVSQANQNVMQANPTIAAGDFKVSIDGGALTNLATLPTVTPAGGKMVKVTLSTSEMAGANATVVCSDAAGAEWCDVVFNVQTSARQIDDLATGSSGLRKNIAKAAFPFAMVLAADHVTPATGLTIIAKRSIDGGAFAVCANAATEVSQGVYVIDLAAADLNGTFIVFSFAGALADTTIINVETTP